MLEILVFVVLILIVALFYYSTNEQFVNMEEYFDKSNYKAIPSYERAWVVDKQCVHDPIYNRVSCYNSRPYFYDSTPFEIKPDLTQYWKWKEFRPSKTSYSNIYI